MMLCRGPVAAAVPLLIAAAALTGSAEGEAQGAPCATPDGGASTDPVSDSCGSPP